MYNGYHHYPLYETTTTTHSEAVNRAPYWDITDHIPLNHNKNQEKCVDFPKTFKKLIFGSFWHQPTLPFQFTKYCIPWEIEITLPYVFILCLLVKNCFPVLFHIICASTTECSFTAIISSCIKLCLMTLSPVRNYQESPIWHKLVI